MNISHDIVNSELDMTPEQIIALGFVQTDDGSGSPWGIGWEMHTKDFWISIDCTNVVHLLRKNPDSDPITVYVAEPYDLQNLICFIQD